MADTNAPVQSLTINEYTSSPTFIKDKNTITILNGSATEVLTIGIVGSGQSVNLKSGQTLTLTSSTGFVLPNIQLSGTNLEAEVVSD